MKNKVPKKITQKFLHFKKSIAKAILLSKVQIFFQAAFKILTYLVFSQLLITKWNIKYLNNTHSKLPQIVRIFLIFLIRKPTVDYPSFLSPPPGDRETIETQTTRNQPWMSDDAYFSACSHSNGSQFWILYCTIIIGCNFVVAKFDLHFKSNELRNQILNFLFSNHANTLKICVSQWIISFPWKMIFFFCVINFTLKTPNCCHYNTCMFSNKH